MIDKSALQAYDVCVVGAGPAGIAVSLELADLGLSVALVESGTEGYSPASQLLSDAEVLSNESHSVMADAVHRGLGGTSAFWGGRCVPLDAIDFEKREFVSKSDWPLTEHDLQPFYRRACAILDAGDANFSVNTCEELATSKQPLSAKFGDTDIFCATKLERWSRVTNVWVSHQSKLQSHPHITILSGLTCVGLRQAELGGAVSEVLVQQTSSDVLAPASIKARFFVLACGGIECTRLVLNSIQDPLGLKLASTELVGRYYMGHPSGKITDIELSGDPNKTLYGFEKDGNVFVRRRITFSPATLQNEKLLNIAFWLDNAPISDWHHGSGVLSAAYLALTAPWLGRLLAPEAIRKRVVGENSIKRLHHIWNCLRSPFKTLLFCVQFLYQRYIAKPRLPGFFTFSSTNRYALHYHAEQAPNWNSTITLSDQVDALGMRRARVLLEWSAQDIDSIIRAHEVLDAALQESGVGRLIYRYPTADLKQTIQVQAIDGFHQIGTLRMGSDASKGVTDPYGRLYGTSNCYVASSATFPTSGQANPTLALVALAVRQAQHIVACAANPESLHA
ncbi:MAG: GMC family oxidoreductase [Cytophaga sp.]|nr:GMC family oxidoreductase [Undibacterium sp.]